MEYRCVSGDVMRTMLTRPYPIGIGFVAGKGYASVIDVFYDTLPLLPIYINTKQDMLLLCGQVYPTLL